MTSESSVAGHYQFYARENNQEAIDFLRTKAIVILSVCLSVRPSVRHMGGSVNNGAS